MAKFKCVLSGNVIEFTNKVDIDSMYGHEGYVRLDEQEQDTPQPTPVVKKQTAVKGKQGNSKVKQTITEE